MCRTVIHFKVLAFTILVCAIENLSSLTCEVGVENPSMFNVEACVPTWLSARVYLYLNI